MVEVLFEQVAGLDVGKASPTVCVRTPGLGSRRVGETRTVKTTTRALEGRRDWQGWGSASNAAGGHAAEQPAHSRFVVWPDHAYACPLVTHSHAAVVLCGAAPTLADGALTTLRRRPLTYS